MCNHTLNEIRSLLLQELLNKPIYKPKRHFTMQITTLLTPHLNRGTIFYKGLTKIYSMKMINLRANFFNISYLKLSSP